MIKTRQELYNEIDMLNGNINRMCVCKRLEEIYKYNINRLDDKERENK